ncbi:serine hydrolase domain-containing protein [Tenacibaculum caenipelagi]|uniref:CubicO group peptidase (Beta-lactamase class C family) n=1 Tax=Tenacibaculum caenipelagi TaxID=1325435 RepID=A0A4R6TBM0_9FLAO|nr:serine hydrolase domain-containing protein [Tenacibaculum caenipelagi]TDQ25591.1 CubicO group peptidase (beta-lactamase class C family) [Tenacibaculum caenipelagi]
MKNIFSILLIIILFQSCKGKSTTETTIDLTKKVENGLTTPVYIEGDSTWSIEERMKHYGIPGASIAVIHNGKIVWTKGYGVTDKESNTPVTEQTLFQAALISMPVTSYGALKLVEQHKVSLDENINSYLKSWKLPDNEFTKEKKATIRNLLNHSAGINLHGIPGYSTDSAIPTLIEILNGTPPAANDPVFANKEPDESIYVSAAGYEIIQQMMIDIEGKTFPEIMNDLVLQPLEMNNSTFNQSLTTKQLTLAATGYLADGSMVKGKRYHYPGMASNGLWTTAEDIAKFIIHIQQTLKGNRSRGLSKNMTELMVTPYGKSSYGTWFQYGLGIQQLNKKDDLYLRHWGWNRGVYAEIMAHRDKDYGVVVLTNSTFPAFNAEVIRAVAQAYEWDNYVPVHKKVEIEQSLVDEIKGRYEGDDVIVEVFQKDNQLFAKNILDEKAEELIKVSDSIFVRRNASRLIQFKPDSENETVNLLYLDRNNGTIAASLVKRNNYNKRPVEFLLEGDFEETLNAYKVLLEQNPTHPTVTEDYLNELGYRFFHEDRMALSQNAFKVNMMLYPDSFKVYDSYAEACMKVGANDLAILNYTKSLELNPLNNRARHKLKELLKSE